MKRIKSQDTLSHIPVLMLTAKTDLVTQTKALRIGVDDYMLKPFDYGILKAHIIHLLDFSENRKKTATVSPIKQDADNSNNSAEPPKENLSKTNQEWLAQFEAIVLALADDVYLDLDKVAHEMGISKTHLNRKANDVLGMSTKRYIREVRLIKARKMLENKEYGSVKAVAYSVGFRSDKTFSRNFKSRFGKYPSEYLTP